MSYANMIMYGAVLPSYRKPKSGDSQEEQDIVKVDDPNNSEKVRKFLDSIE